MSCLPPLAHRFSVAMCRDPPLLKREGRLLFQAPGGERGHVRVSAVARQKGFKVLGASPDDRGVLRVVVLCHDPAGRDQTRTSDA